MTLKTSAGLAVLSAALGGCAMMDPAGLPGVLLLCGSGLALVGAAAAEYDHDAQNDQRRRTRQRRKAVRVQLLREAEELERQVRGYRIARECEELWAARATGDACRPREN